MRSWRREGENGGSGREVVVDKGEWKESESQPCGIDGGLKLRSLSKITLDISACKSDVKIKNCIILYVFKTC